MRLLRPQTEEDAPLTSEAITRQTLIYNTIVKGAQLRTITQFKALAIMNLLPTSATQVAAYIENWDEISNLPWLNCPVSRNKIFTTPYKFKIGTPLRITPKRPLIVTETHLDPMELPLVVDSPVNLKDFESLVFSGKVVEPFEEDKSFLTYLIANLYWYADADDSVWQYRFIKVLLASKSEYVAREAFYQDSVSYMGIVYDTSFVPKYPVAGLRDIPQNVRYPDIISFINYYNDLRVNADTIIPYEYREYFKIIPFIDSYQIIPENGTVKYITPLKQPTPWTLPLDVCHKGGGQATDIYIDTMLQSMDTDTITNHCIRGRDLKIKIICLMALRRNSDKLQITCCSKQNPIQIAPYDILSRLLRFSCIPDGEFEARPFGLNDDRIPTIDLCMNLITDIAKTSQTFEDIATICSHFILPSCRIGDLSTRIMNNGKNDLEKFVFLTILKQQHPKNIQICTRYASLNPNLNKSNENAMFDYIKFKSLFNKIRYTPDILEERKIIIPSGINLEHWRFTNEQLQDLVLTGKAHMTVRQQAELLSMLITLD